MECFITYLKDTEYFIQNYSLILVLNYRSKHEKPYNHNTVKPLKGLVQ